MEGRYPLYGINKKVLFYGKFLVSCFFIVIEADYDFDIIWRKFYNNNPSFQEILETFNNQFTELGYNRIGFMKQNTNHTLCSNFFHRVMFCNRTLKKKKHRTNRTRQNENIRSEGKIKPHLQYELNLYLLRGIVKLYEPVCFHFTFALSTKLQI